MLTDGVIKFGNGRGRGGMAIGKCKHFCRAMVCWNERIANFTGIGGACGVSHCRGDESIEYFFLELLFGEWLAW